MFSLLIACRKDKIDESEGPYTERILYSETFDQLGTWTSTPDTIFNPDTAEVSIGYGLLKLTFNPLTQGGAWVGAQLDAPEIQEDSILSRLGFRIILDSGYFQHRTRITGTTGSTVCQSEVRLYYNDVELMLPSPYYGRFESGSTFDPDEFRVDGKVFELVSDRGARTFTVDGQEHPLPEAYFNVNGMSNHPLKVWVTLGHGAELYPRIDHLAVDKIEIFTWSGDRPD